MSGLMGGNIGWSPSNFQAMFDGGELGDGWNQVQQTLANQGRTMGFSPAPMSAPQPAANPLGQAGASLFRQQSGGPQPDPARAVEPQFGLPPGNQRGVGLVLNPPQQGSGPGMGQMPPGNQRGGGLGGLRGMPDPRMARIPQQMGNTGAMPPQQGGGLFGMPLENQQQLIAALLTKLMRGGLMGGSPEGM